MNTLKRVLEQTLPNVTSLGGSGRNVDRDLLVDMLRRLGGDLVVAYRLRSVLAGAILLILLIVIGRYGGQPTILAGAATGIGITLMGALVSLKQVIDEMARVNMILSVAPDLSLEALTEVSRKVAATL